MHISNTNTCTKTWKRHKMNIKVRVTKKCYLGTVSFNLKWSMFVCSYNKFNVYTIIWPFNCMTLSVVTLGNSLDLNIHVTQNNSASHLHPSCLSLGLQFYNNKVKCVKSEANARLYICTCRCAKEAWAQLFKDLDCLFVFLSRPIMFDITLFPNGNNCNIKPDWSE